METWAVQPSTTKVLANLYNVSTKVFRRWLVPFQKEIGPRNGYYYTVKQVQVIFDVLGLPPEIDVLIHPVKKVR